MPTTHDCVMPIDALGPSVGAPGSGSRNETRTPRQIRSSPCDDPNVQAQQATDAGRSHLRALFVAEADRIHGYLLLRAGSPAVAEDITGEVFSAAARRCAQGHHDEVTGAWLQTVAKRRLVDHWRRSATQRRLKARLARGATLTVPGIDSHQDDDDRVRDALSSLPDRQRAALCLRYLDDFSVSEVAQSLGVRYQAAESLLARARRSFAAAYEAIS